MDERLRPGAQARPPPAENEGRPRQGGADADHELELQGRKALHRHVGPMAQDFYAAFGLGLDDKHITTIDEGGVALAAIQGLYRQNTALRAEEPDGSAWENRSLRVQLGAQNARLTKLDSVLDSRGNPVTSRGPRRGGSLHLSEPRVALAEEPTTKRDQQEASEIARACSTANRPRIDSEQRAGSVAERPKPRRSALISAVSRRLPKLRAPMRRRERSERRADQSRPRHGRRGDAALLSRGAGPSGGGEP